MPCTWARAAMHTRYERRAPRSACSEPREGSWQMLHVRNHACRSTRDAHLTPSERLRVPSGKCCTSAIMHVGRHVTHTMRVDAGRGLAQTRQAAQVRCCRTRVLGQQRHRPLGRTIWGGCFHATAQKATGTRGDGWQMLHVRKHACRTTPAAIDACGSRSAEPTRGMPVLRFVNANASGREYDDRQSPLGGCLRCSASAKRTTCTKDGLQRTT